MHVVYLLTMMNGKSYVGVTKDLTLRMAGHRSTDSVVGRALRKHGLRYAEVLAEFEDRSEAHNFEIAEIASRDCRVPRGYNVSPGGEGVRDVPWTPERRAKQPKPSPENQKAMHDYLKSESGRARMAELARERMKDPDYKQRCTHRTPLQRARFAEMGKTAMLVPGAREKAQQSARDRWADPTKRAQLMAARQRNKT